MNNISNLGREITQALEKQRLTKKWLYAKMGISRGTLDNWISGATAPDHNQLQEMYNFLGIGVHTEKQVRSMRDVIEDQSYIAMHKRVYDQLEENWVTNRELLKQAMDTIKS